MAESIDEARCLNCAYQLRGISSRRCPECGRAFDPPDLDTMKIPGRVSPRENPSLRGLMFTLSVSGAFFCAVGIDHEAEYLVLGMCLMAVPFVALCCGFFFDDTQMERALNLWPGLPWRRLVAIVLVLGILSTLRIHECPHAYSVTVLRLGLAWSDFGGPCRNPPHHGGSHLFGPWYYVVE